MTEKDYIAISNTGKNITISMTHGMKRHILGDYNRIRLRFVRSGNFAVLLPASGVSGYKIFRRKNVWNMTMASARFSYWPKHGRIVVPASAVEISNMGAIVELPTHTVNWVEEITAAPVKTASFGPGKTIPPRPDPAFHPYTPATESRFTTPDMITMAIGGGCVGFTIALLIELAGALK